MRQRGVALITAIVVVAIATILAVRIGTRAALDLRRTAGLVALDQGWHVALGAEAWAIEVLKEDYEDSPDSDHLAEGWAQPLPPLPVDGGEVRGAVEDMQGRLVFQLAERLGDFVFDFLLVERPGQRRLLCARHAVRVVGSFPAIVYDKNVECAHAAGDYKAALRGGTHGLQTVARDGDRSDVRTLE